MKWTPAIILLAVFGFTQCASESDDDFLISLGPTGEEREFVDVDYTLIENRFQNKIELPAIWTETPEKSWVSRILLNDDESYYYAVTTEGERINYLIGKTERGSTRRDYAFFTEQPTHYVNQLWVYHDPWASSTEPVEFIYPGGIDRENIYATENDVDSAFINFPETSLVAGNVPLSDRSAFTSITRNYRYYYFIASGNVYQEDNTVLPFLAAMNRQTSSWRFDSVRLIQYYPELENVEFIRAYYDLTDEGVHVVGYDNTTQNVHVLFFEHQDLNDDRIVQKNDRLNLVRGTEVNVGKINKDFANFVQMGPNTLIAGTEVGEFGEHGTVISINRETGAINWKEEYEFNEGDDGFLGITFSGESVFAYGYCNKTDDTSDGWVLRINEEDGDVRQSHLFSEEGAHIEVTTATRGLNHSNSGGYVVIGGTKKVGSTYSTFATHFSHSHN